MAKLVWDNIGSRLFDAGVSHGVVYFENGESVAWNGLTEVTINPKNNTVENIFFDGEKLFPYIGEEDFSATISALTYPDSFSEVNGEEELSVGVRTSSQKNKYFHLSYKTIVGNDIDGAEKGYKIHVLYNLLASPSTSQHTSISDSITSVDFQWDLISKPEVVPNYRPTAHVIIDSTRMKPEVLEYIEDILYGTPTSEPTLPPLADFSKNVIEWGLIIVEDNGDGTWTATGPDEYFTMLDATTFEITNINGFFLNTNTYQISSSTPD